MRDRELPTADSGSTARQEPVDRLHRPVRDLRISVTDRCNFRCRYCMPREVFGPDFQFLPKQLLLSFEEIGRLARAFHRLGVRKFRITGGEPTLRQELPELIGELAGLDGSEIALTTNGSSLDRQAKRLVDAGLDRITVSLDSLDEQTFQRMNDADFPVARVLSGIDGALSAGLTVKINAVVQKGVNDRQLLDLARRFHGSAVIVRFIEFMDVGTTNGWRLDDVVSGSEIVEQIDSELPLEPASPNYDGEVARRYRYRDGGGEIGIITSVTQPFCGDCTRARLSTDGKLFTCLFATVGTDLRALLRNGATDDDLEARIAAVWRDREDRYSELRSSETRGLERVEMSYIGG